MILKKEIENMPVLPAKARGDDSYIGRIRMHKGTLVMDVYAMMVMVPAGEEKEAEIMFRWVCDKKNYYTYVFRSKKWVSQGMYYAMHGYNGWGQDTGIRLDSESQEIAKEFLDGVKAGIHQRSYADKLQELEDNIREEKREREYDRNRERIRARQEKRKPLPRDWERFLKNKVYRNENYIFYEAGSRKTGNCAHCGTTVGLSGKQRHNQWGKCPHCGTRIQYKAVGITSQMTDKKKAVYLQKTEDGFLARYFETVKKSTPEGEWYKSRECVMVTYGQKKTWYDYCEINDFYRTEYWSDRKPLAMKNWKGEGILYTRNAKQAVEDTIFKYAPLTQWAQHEKDGVPLELFMAKYPNNRFLEFFIKAGLFRLTREYLESYEKWDGSRPQDILGIDRQRIRRLIQMDGGMTALGWLQYEEKTGKKVTDEVIKYLEGVSVNRGRCETLLKELGSVERMANYMKKQTMAPKELVYIWNDYLRMAKQEGYDITDDIVRFPKDLRQRHDQLVDMQNQREERKKLRKYEKLDEQIRERIPETGRYFWENKNYMIIPAGGCEELMIEGRTLHHCVGRDDHYMKKMAAGESWICFLRKKEEPETPYYTLEIDMNTDEILQWYAAFDRKPDEETIRKVLEKYKNSIRKKREAAKIQIRQSVAIA